MPDTTPPHNDAQQLYLLGQIHAMVESLKAGQAAQAQRLELLQASNEQQLSRMEDVLTRRIDGVDERLRIVEQKAAVSGAVSGGVMGVGVALLIEGGRALLRASGKAP
jgi:hypothetical protein